MYVPGPSLIPILKVDKMADFLEEMGSVHSIYGGVAVYGPAAAYALVWEMGSRRIKKPGPKTVWGTNRNGERVILSSQAPGGYVGVNEASYWPILLAELAKVNFSGGNLQLRLEVAMDNASQEMARLIAASAPKDSGDLSSGIELIDSSDMSSMDISNDESDGTFIF